MYENDAFSRIQKSSLALSTRHIWKLLHIASIARTAAERFYSSDGMPKLRTSGGKRELSALRMTISNESGINGRDSDYDRRG